MLQLVHDAVGINAFQTRIAMYPGGVHPDLERIQRYRRNIHGIESHRHHRYRNLLTCGQEHIQLALGRIRINLLCLGNQLVRSLTHCGKDEHNVVALFEILCASSCHIHDAVLIPYRGSAKFFHYQHYFFSSNSLSISS